ncbi:heme lyase CcmF/NrfE family subunit [Gilvimarinus sp. SDUM040013]|uniref:Heme lyase CcmF/NrfE family subunit n=1 Tax=Gilvimarinus gilvus TaxID=3058038 RepID=A0ABU4S5J9_9GAMM|nr:heme lyase CcmF/NrfE family subunit [Gilvimarinus sp. SDUM040013]MDO3385581.1 heme lyase CcmF/NrfE family subunit [Gilvimarinus sp. SDUM040013]MDX6851168.1 heme lyase CcmF/NrfE family subunit [Gilvimarinus sp. SDUM040013]
MVPELGHFALIIALALSAGLFVLPLWGAFKGNAILMHTGRSLATGQFVMISVALVCLGYAFLHDDFSVSYVAGHSNSLMPVYYKISAIWGGHEGSLLLWIFMLSGWTFAIALLSRSLPLDMQARVLAVMGFVATGFALFILLTSNPFDRILPMAPLEGSDLNPLLQDPGLIFHPPLLYMGYVGFSTVFAFAIAALLTGKLDTAWARWSRPWATTAWAFLTLGLALGSWWAYYELGWGGWWFWDPVENAAFMPWLVGTALIHSLAVTEKRGFFKSWTILLAIFAFSLSLLGTFLVRSGVLNSIHAFANDPERGLFVLGFLGVVVGGSLLLFALRAPVVKSRPGFSLFSREALLLANNVLLVISMVTVLFGTLFPLIADALKLGKYSVGAPYFNLTFTPFITLVCLLMGVAPFSRWKRSSGSAIRAALKVPLVAAALMAIIVPPILGGYTAIAVAAAFIGSWVFVTTWTDLFVKSNHRLGLRKGLSQLSLSYWGMVFAHTGIAFAVLGVGFTTQYSDEQKVRMSVGEPVQVAGREFTLESLTKVQGPNYVADEALVVMRKDGKLIREFKPQKRRYLASGQIMTEVAISPGFWRDIYIAVGESENISPNTRPMRIHYNAFVRWIWLGALLMALGGLLAVVDKRYRKRVPQNVGAVSTQSTSVEAS